jgi:hypothetical protein
VPAALRIAFLTRQEEDLIKTKRARIEQFLWMAHETDPAAFWETVVEDAIDKDGEPILGADGKPLTRRYQRLKLFSELEPEHRMLIESLTYTENGYPNLQVVKKSWANVELRKFLGLDAPPRSKLDVEHSGKMTLEALVLASVALREEREKIIGQTAA